MEKIGIIIFVLLLIVSCKKDKPVVVVNNEKKILSPTDYFSIPTNLNNLKNIKKVIVNDTVTKIDGDFEKYKITGYINQNDQRINWWNIVDKDDKNANNARLQYKIIDKKEYLNQYIFYNSKEGIYKINSLFYLKDTINGVIQFKFYTPQKKIKINSSASFFIYILSNNKVISKQDLKCEKERDYFSVTLDVPHQKGIIIKGLFEEVYQYKNGELGVHDIYVLDTITQ